MRSTPALCALFLTVVLGACSSEPAAPESVTGVVVDITEGEGFGAVESFEVRSDGENYEILIDPERKYEFPLAHLNDHLQGADPVRVVLEDRDGALYAVTITDA